MYNKPKDPLDALEQNFLSIKPHDGFLHDSYVIAAIEEAFAAAREGNFGVGAVIVDPQGNIVERGHNHVFHPHFRSDLHAEMDTMDKFEDNNTNVTCLREYTLFTSLEPCPMCLTRLITSGVGKVYHAAPDIESGMSVDNLTKVWRELAQSQVFSQANCSQELRVIAHEVFLVTANRNTRKLFSRRQG